MLSAKCQVPSAAPAELRSAGQVGHLPVSIRGRYWVRIPAVRFVHLALLVGCTSLLFGQARKPARPAASSPSRLISIKETGSTRYTPDQVIAATGLRLGQTVSEDDFKLVSQHLGETGAFSNVAYSFQFSAEGIKLDLQVTDSNQFVPVRFENFVWLS